jgi:flagellar hook-length control protein FliK
MMGAVSLPLPQAATPPGFAAFLAAIGQTSTGGEAGGFDQLLAAAPVHGAITVKIDPDPSADSSIVATASAAIPAPAAAPASPAIPVAETGGAETHVAPAQPVVVAKAGETNIATNTVAAVASAEKLLVAAKGGAPHPDRTTGKVATVEGATKAEPDIKVEAEPKVEVEAKTEAHAAAASPDQAAPADPATSWTPVVAAMPVLAPALGKPIKAAETAALSTGDAAPAGDPVPAASAAPVAPIANKSRNPADKPAASTSEAAPMAPMAEKPQTAAPRVAAMAITGAEPAVAKPAETAPSMTVLFAHPTTPGAALLADAASPIGAADRVLDMDSEGAWIDQLAHDIAATKSDRGDISFRLMPRHLGRLDVAMLMRDDGVALKMDTQHEAAATIVTAAQGRLVDDLRQQGVRVTGSEVTCTPNDTGRQMQGQSQGQGRGAAQDVSHLIETVTERVKARDPEDAADRRGRFA